MISVTVKTLDSQNHAFDVEGEIKVKEFKEVISPTIGIPVDQQRLIFRGRVLQDDKKISEYNVAGSVVHVVQRPANQNNPANDEPPPRPSSQAGRDGGGGLFITGDEGGGRNAIIMGAIGLPTIDIENGAGLGGENGHGGPRRSGAQVRLMVGNHMLNRASNLLHQLEDDDATVAAAAAAAGSSSSGPAGSGQGQNQSSPSADIGLLIEEEGEIEMDIDMAEEDDQESLQRIISQVVNASSAAALVAAVGQVHPGGGGAGAGVGGIGGLPPQPPQPPSASNVGASTVPGVIVPPASTGPGSVSSDASGASNAATAGSSGSQSGRTVGRPESPRLRELATSLQDILALQERLTPFLRFLQSALSQNREYNEPGETQSTQFLYDTISNILHLLSHSLHAFSDIMCDFSTAPEQRRLIASSSILVEQSTVVRATIPVAAVPAMYAAGGGLGLGANVAAGAGGAGAQPNSQPGGGNAANPLAGLGFSLPMGQMQMGQGMPLGFSMPMGGGMRFMPSGMNQPWRNPNLQATTNTTPPTGGTGAAQTTAGAPNPPPQQPQQQQPPPQGNNANGHGPAMGNAQQIPGLPAGLQNLGALLGMAGGGSTVNVNVFAGPAGGGGGAGAFFPQGTIPLGSFRSQIPPNNNNPGGAGAGTGTGPTMAAVGTPGGLFVFPQQPNVAGGQGQGQQNPPSANNSGSNSTASNGARAAGGNNNQPNGGGAGMLQNLLRNEMNRPQFDTLLPCHTIHSSGARYSRLSHPNQPPHPTRRPAEFRQFVNLEGQAQQQGGGVWGQAEGESLEIIMDLVRNSRLIDYWLVPLARDAVLNYLMRGRDPKNDAHVRTCAKSLAKKLMPFLDKFWSKIEGKNEAVDIPTTYSNIFTEFIATLMKKIIEGGSHFQKDLLNALTELQKNLVQAFRLCYSSIGVGNNSVGLRFVNYLVDQLLGGMSIIFKNQVRQKLTAQLKEIEGQAAGVGDAGCGTFIVYKDNKAPLVGPPTPPKTMATAASGSGNVVPSPPPSSNTLLGSRCGATFGDASSSSSVAGGAESGGAPGPSSSTGSPVKQEPVSGKAAAVSDDLDIDEVLQLPPSMVQQSSPQRRTAPVGGSPPATNQTESFATLVRNLPSEWENTVVQDVRRQRDMPAQASFSPGYNTLFPRKH